MNEPAIQDCYDPEFQHCYGCGERNDAGLKIKSFREGDEVVARFAVRPDQLGVPGVVYGGLIASLIDCHGIATGAAHFQDRDGLPHPPRCVTASLKVDYRKPTMMASGTVHLRARVVEASERKAVVDIEFGDGETVTAEGQVIAVKLPEHLQGGT